MVLIAPTEREARIEVGRGLEGVMTDLMSHRIVDEYMMPAFQQEAYFDGISQALSVITPILRGEVVVLPDPPVTLADKVMPILALIMFFGWSILSILSASRSWWL